LSPTLWGFVRFFPEALFNALFRPFIEDCHYLLQYISSLEMMFFVFGLAGVIFFYRKAARKQPLHYFLLFYALSNFALIGYLLSNSGTIARYRCVALSFSLSLCNGERGGGECGKGLGGGGLGGGVLGGGGFSGGGDEGGRDEGSGDGGSGGTHKQR
jgi:hypothetical protein